MGILPESLPPNLFESTTNNERWPEELAGRVLAAGFGKGTKYWIVLDGFRGPNLRDDTRKFIAGLADTMSKSGVYARTYRLVLIDFDRTFLTVQPGNVDVEQISAFGRTDVFDCVLEILTQANRPNAAQKVGPVVDRILTDLPTDEQRMFELNQRLSDLIQAIEEGADA